MTDINHPSQNKHNSLMPNKWMIILILISMITPPLLIHKSKSKSKNLEQKKETKFNLSQYKKFIAKNEVQILGQGKKLYKKNCRACHGSFGEGGVGPNLTDKYWIHGKGQSLDIYRVIDEGIVDRGMAAWGEVLDHEQMMAITAYVLSLKGSMPTNAKEAQGTLYE